MLRLLATALVCAAVASPFAQRRSDWGVMNLEAPIGSFKILKFNRQAPAEGKLEISFSGTLLISDYVGSPIEPTIKGNIRREFPDPKTLPGMDGKKLVYHGTGSLTVSGKYIGIQWFGTNLKARWHGAGIIRFFGEVDRKGNTGSYYFNDDRSLMRPWPGQQIVLPRDVPVQPKGPVMGPTGTTGGR